MIQRYLFLWIVVFSFTLMAAEESLEELTREFEASEQQLTDAAQALKEAQDARKQATSHLIAAHRVKLHEAYQSLKEELEKGEDTNELMVSVLTHALLRKKDRFVQFKEEHGAKRNDPLPVLTEEETLLREVKKSA